MAIPILNTPRLHLRPLNLADAYSIYQMRSSLEMLRYVNMEPFTHLDQAQQLLIDLFRESEQGQVYLWGLCLSQTPNLLDTSVVGTICLCNIQQEGTTAEVGFELMETQQNQGLMTEALEEILRFGFTKLGLMQIYAITHEHNLPSLALLTKQHFKKIAPTDEDNMFLYALLKEDYNYKVLD